jgi:hypothetical protein
MCGFVVGHDVSLLSKPNRAEAVRGLSWGAWLRIEHLSLHGPLGSTAALEKTEIRAALGAMALA